MVEVDSCSRAAPLRFTRGQQTIGKQQSLFIEPPTINRFPPTRYQGSKLKLLKWIWSSISHLAFDTCLDLFSGTGSVSYLFKVKGKRVTANDYLQCNRIIAQALVVNEGSTYDLSRATALFQRCSDRTYQSFIESTFDKIYFLRDENTWLDTVVQNISVHSQPFQKELALFALFQSCLAKRPYNLFHRANLYMRTADVERTFGNKATWDKPFSEHFLSSLADANQAVFKSGRTHRAVCADFREVEGAFDLVYIDPPYLNAKGVGVDYLDFYHFLEGLTDYYTWPDKITTEYKHKPFRKRRNPWNNKSHILAAFDHAIERYRDSIIVISYRSDGIPSVDELSSLLVRHGRRNVLSSSRDYKYVLSNGKGKEVLLVSEP